MSLFAIDTRERARVEELHGSTVEDLGVRLFIKRDDLIHPEVSGNKYRKLKYNIQQAQDRGCDTLISFGGAWSNHIHALARAAQLCDFKSIGIIRGEASYASNPTLSFARDCGMQLQFVDRQTYRLRQDPRWLSQLQSQHPTACIIPEGGSNALAMQGVAELWRDLDEHYDVLVTAAGTGGTAAGLIASAPPRTRVVVVPVLKGDFMAQAIVELLGDDSTALQRHEVLGGYHGGGYARLNAELRQFIREFEAQHQIPLDPVYTAKMVWAVYREAGAGRFAPGTRILMLHTGGLQGRQSDLL